MWRARVQRSIAEIRFNLKQGPEHHGVWHWVNTKLPDIRMLNQNTFFAIHEMSDDFKTDSAIHFIFRDEDETLQTVQATGLTSQQFDEIMKQQTAFGQTLKIEPRYNNYERDIPVDIVESRCHVHHMDDGF